MLRKSTQLCNRILHSFNVSPYLSYREVFMSMAHGAHGRLDLRVPAVVDASCNCFCWRQPVDPVVVLENDNTLAAVKRANDQKCRLAVQAIFDEIIRRCHPRFDLASEIIESCGFKILHPPKALTVAQLAIIRERLDAIDPPSEKMDGKSNED
jgi:hypothetical protein